MRINGRGPAQNIVIVATENDSVYAFDANNPSAGPHHDGILWQHTYVDPAQGIYPVTSLDISSPDIQPIVGITGTPVIDANSGYMYFVTKYKVIRAPATCRSPAG